MTFQPPPPPPPQGPPPQGPTPPGQNPPGPGAGPSGPPPYTPPAQGPEYGAPPTQGPGYGAPPAQGPGYGAPPPTAPQGQPPASQWGPPPGRPTRSSGSFDPKSVNQLDWGILGAGVLAFIFSFVSYYSYSGGGVTVTDSAWHGFFGWFAMLLALIGSAVVALEIFMPQVRLPFPNRLVALGAYALATVSVILALIIVPSSVCSGGVCGNVPDSVDKGHGAGYWISLIVIIAGLALSFLRFQQTGGQLPIGRGGRPSAGGSTGYGTPPPPPNR